MTRTARDDVDDALLTADRVMQRIHADPNDDLGLLARQLLLARAEVALWRKLYKAAMSSQQQRQGGERSAERGSTRRPR